MKKAWIRLAASVVLSALLVVGISASGILTNGHRTDGLFDQASGIRPDAELLTVNGETIDAEEYLYWLAYDCEYLAYNVQDLDFDAELSEGMTYGAYAKQDALETVKLYAVVRQWAKRGNVTLSDADREALENQRQQYITYYGSQEAYSKQIQGMGVSEAMFDAISRGYYLYAGVRQAFCTPGSALYPAQEDIDALARQKGYATSLLLYWPLDGQDDDNTRLAAESFAQQLRDAQDVTAAYLDLAGQLGMEDVTEAGVTASAGEGGAIDPAGQTLVKKGTSKTFTVTPAQGYEIANVNVDGTDLGPISYYTFQRVGVDHTISATFQKTQQSGDVVLFDNDFESVTGESFPFHGWSLKGVNTNGYTWKQQTYWNWKDVNDLYLR